MSFFEGVLLFLCFVAWLLWSAAKKEVQELEEEVEALELGAEVRDARDAAVQQVMADAHGIEIEYLDEANVHVSSSKEAN